MAFSVSANTSVSGSNQITNLYTESDKLLDQSVKDTTIQNYVSSLISRSNNKETIIQNFIENIESSVDSIQKNTLTFSGCMEVDDITVAQSNVLIQDSIQGFEKLFEDVNNLKQALGIDSTNETEADQNTSAAQGATGSSDQSQDTSQSTDQLTDQKATFTPRFIMTPTTSTLPSMNYINQARIGLGRSKINSESYKTFDKPKQETFKFFTGKSNTNKIEPFCVFGCASVNTSVSAANQESNSTAIDQQTILQTQDIYKKINTAYDKTVEIIQEVVKEYNETINSIASAKSTQINELIFTNENACLLKLKNLNVSQANDLRQTVELKTAIKNLNTLDIDNETKAIVTDMLGLTQSSDVDQTGTLETTQDNTTTQDSSQITTQVAETGGSWTIIIVIIILAIVGYTFYKSYTSKLLDSYFDSVDANDDTETK